MLRAAYARGWRSVVRGTEEARLVALSRRLWETPADGFLPHGLAEDGRAERQPIWLTTAGDRPNGAKTLFLIDGAEASTDEMAELETVALIFDGADERAVGAARADWKRVTGAGLRAVYWAETEAGGWEKKAEAGAS